MDYCARVCFLGPGSHRELGPVGILVLAPYPRLRSRRGQPPTWLLHARFQIRRCHSGTGPWRRCRSCEARCQPERNECREGRLVARAERVFGALDGVPEVDPTLLATAWKELQRHGGLPLVRDPQYRDSGAPKAGLALLFVKGSQDLLLLAYRTSEIANDRYAYSEVLQEVGPGRTSIIHQTRFFLDIAGLEGLEWPILWPLDFVVLLAIWILTMRRRPWQPEERWGALAGGLGALPILVYLNRNALSPEAYSVDDGELLVMPLLNLSTLAVGVLIGRGLGRLTWHLRRSASAS